MVSVFMAINIIDTKKIHPRKALYDLIKLYFRNEKSIEEIVELLDNKVSAK